MSVLLPVHKSITDKLCDPSSNDLLLLARGLGLQRIICKLLQIYDSPHNLVLLVNASPGEENGIGEELSILGCRKPGLRVVGYELGKRDRKDLYKRGGLVSVTSQILIVDMLQGDIPTELISGIMILHAERVSDLSPEAFIVRLYREKNQTGFVKAFSDQPEHITSGISPLRNIVKELKLRHVYLYPRFHEEVKASVEKKTFQTIQLYQHLTDAMANIHEAIIQCITSTLSELKRSNTSLDLDEFTVENAYFRSFDAIVRRQLDSVWHKVGPKTKQLVNDLATLRRLLTYLLAYDAVAFHAYLETIVASNAPANSREAGQYKSPWLLTDAANIIFREAKLRCYTVTSATGGTSIGLTKDLADDPDAWDALDEIEDVIGGRVARTENNRKSSKRWPKDIEPTLEELPKWSRLTAVLMEIEEEIRRQESQGGWDNTPGTNTTLIMTATSRSAADISEYLSTLELDAPIGAQGRVMMEKKLGKYLWWKAKLSESKGEKIGKDKGSRSNSAQKQGEMDDRLSEALKKKDRDRRDRAANRRRVRGAAPSTIAPNDRQNTNPMTTADLIDVDALDETEIIADFLATQTANASLQEEDMQIVENADMISLFTLEEEFDMNYGLVEPPQTILVRAYSDDSDDTMLTELRPRFIIMFDPNLEFIRRVEVYRSSSPGLPVRMYFLMYQACCEEHKFLLSLRREKDAFTRLIQEYAKMPIYLGDRSSGSGTGSSMLKTISTRLAGGRKELNQEPSKVIVDMREFRSTLPSILHASKLLVVPATLTVGDYILTPDICVERKSIPDLVSSFNSGRLYTQCELMSVHYKQPILLIEFEEYKSFSLETTAADAKQYTKPTGKYPPPKQKGAIEKDLAPSIQSKIVLLTLTFPRVRIIWSSSPYATSEIFNDFKMNNPEPDASKAVLVGAEEDPEAGTGINAAAEELLRCLPGITVKNVKHVMNKVRTVREFCEMTLIEVQNILGVEPGKVCWDFMHRGDRRPRP